MGNEVLTRVTFGDQAAETRALLETEELILRGALKARMPFREMTDVRADGDALRFRWNDRDVAIPGAAKWADKIRNPKSVLDKLGVKPSQKITVLGEVDAAFLEELQARGADTSRRLRRDSDVIFFAANLKEELARLGDLRRSLEPAGAIWVLRPKGIPPSPRATSWPRARLPGSSTSKSSASPPPTPPKNW